MVAREPHLLNVLPANRRLRGTSRVRHQMSWHMNRRPRIAVKASPGGWHVKGTVLAQRQGMPNGLNNRVMTDVWKILGPEVSDGLDGVPDTQKSDVAQTGVFALEILHVRF